MFKKENEEEILLDIANNAEVSPNFFDAPHHLYFRYNVGGDLGAISKIKEVSNNPLLESLSFAMTGIGDQVVRFIIEYLIKKEGTILRELDLSGNRFTDDGIRRLLSAIDSTPHCKLQSLLIEGNVLLTEPLFVEAQALMSKQKSKLKV